MEVKYLELFEGLIEFKGKLYHTVESNELDIVQNEYSVSLWICIHQTVKKRQAVILNKASEKFFST